MRKAKSRLPAHFQKGRDVKIFTSGLLLGAYIGVSIFMYADNLQLKARIRDRNANYQCSETMCYEPSIVPSDSTQSGNHGLIPKVMASTKARVTAYSCGGLTTEAEINMNCPSLRYSENGRTANGTEPIPYKTMACDPYNMGKTFHLEGYGEVTCTDTGGAINGAGRFDLYLPTVQEARAFGVQYLEYGLLN